MKKIFLLITAVMLSIYSFSQTETWELLIDTDEDRNVSDIIEGEDNNIYFTGLSREAETWHFNGTVFKLSSEGELRDSIFIMNLDSSVIVNRILPDTNTGYILGVETFGLTPNPNKCGFNLKRIDTNLNITYSSKNYLFPPEYHDIDIKLQYGIKNNLLLFGYIFPVNVPRMFVYELNYDFDSLNAKIYHNDGAILPNFIKQLPDYNFWLVRELHSNYVLLDSSLNMISSKAGAIPKGMNLAHGVKWDSDTSFYLAADFFHAEKRAYTSHNVGFIHQLHPFDSTNAAFNYTGAIDTNDQPAFYRALDFNCKDSIFIGYTKNIDIYGVHWSSRPSWYALVQTDSMLNIRWEKFYGGDAYYNLENLIATNDGGCIMAGTRFDYQEHPFLQERDIYIIKVNADGLITSTDGNVSPIVKEAIAYPNPGNDFLKLRIAVQHKQSVFKLFDISGRLVLEENIEGKTSEVNTQFLKPGTYVYSITSNNGLNESGKWVKE